MGVLSCISERDQRIVFIKRWLRHVAPSLRLGIMYVFDTKNAWRNISLFRILIAPVGISCVRFQIRLCSGESDTGMGQFWVEWDLPADRDVATFWRHSLGLLVVRSATKRDVEVRSSFGSKKSCCHNKYGIMPGYHFGGGFPSTSGCIVGSRDLCMTVAVMTTGSSAHGVTQNGIFSLYDAPTSNSDWPNAKCRDNNGPSFVSVWLR